MIMTRQNLLDTYFGLQKPDTFWNVPTNKISSGTLPLV